MITLTTDEPDYRPVMEYARSTELRHRLFDAYNERCYPTNRDVLLKMLTLRAQLAHLLGFTNYADYAAADKMIGNAANIRSLITELDKIAAPARAREMERLIAYAKTQDPSLTSIPEYSGRYWLNQYETATYNFDSQSVRAYFPFAQVQEGVLSTASRLFHVHFTVVPDAPTWDPSVTVLDVSRRKKAGPDLFRYAPPPRQRQMVQRRPRCLGKTRHRSPGSAAQRQLYRRRKRRSRPHAI